MRRLVASNQELGISLKITATIGCLPLTPSSYFLATACLQQSQDCGQAVKSVWAFMWKNLGGFTQVVFLTTRLSTKTSSFPRPVPGLYHWLIPVFLTDFYPVNRDLSPLSAGLITKTTI